MDQKATCDSAKGNGREIIRHEKEERNIVEKGQNVQIRQVIFKH